MENRILFQEQQKFTQWWLWLLFIVALGFTIIHVFKFSHIFNEVVPNDVVSVASVIIETKDLIPILILMLILVLFRILNLKTEITSDSIYIHYFPLFTKRWKWDDIQTAEIITYGFVGYGIRISLKYGIVYNVKGNKGLALNLKNGKKIVIGTQKPEELEKIFWGILK